ncbi:hypothetical protein D3C87_1933260 [compost metagenome]
MNKYFPLSVQHPREITAKVKVITDWTFALGMYNPIDCFLIGKNSVIDADPQLMRHSYFHIVPTQYENHKAKRKD